MISFQALKIEVKIVLLFRYQKKKLTRKDTSNTHKDALNIDKFILKYWVELTNLLTDINQFDCS